MTKTEVQEHAERVLDKQGYDFFIACIDMNTLNELEAIDFNHPDYSDIKTWRLTESQWQNAIKLAIDYLKAEDE